MISQLILTALFTINAFQPPVKAQIKTTPFTSPSTISTIAPAHSAKIISLKGNLYNQKIIIDWVVEDNQLANMFEVEKSYDGKNFTVAAIVFGTDEGTVNNYQFYEKKSNKKVSYRIKIINKNKEIEYSDPIIISPSA